MTQNQKNTIVLITRAIMNMETELRMTGVTLEELHTYLMTHNVPLSPEALQRYLDAMQRASLVTETLDDALITYTLTHDARERFTRKLEENKRTRTLHAMHDTYITAEANNDLNTMTKVGRLIAKMYA